MKRPTWFVLAVTLLLVALGAPISDTLLPVLAQAPGLDVVQIEGGLVAPTLDSGADLRVFKMIPFAAPPVGALRWKPPQPVTPWPGVRRADWFSPSCMQVPIAADTIFYGVQEVPAEDCLYLNIWTGAKSAGDKLPVIFSVHGGASRQTSAAYPLYDGTNFAKKGVVLVGPNYRLGPLGFLAHPELTKESGGSKTSGNYGYMDLIAALRWVQKNIAAFGGDPNNVTIYGDGNGAQNVCNLTISPLAKGLFHRAIGPSESCFDYNSEPVLAPNLAKAEQLGADWARKNFTATTAAELRAVSANDLVKVAEPYAPYMLDGYVLPDYAYKVYASGQQIDVPLLAGWNRNEGSTRAPMGSTVVSYTVAVQTRFGKFADQFLKAYPATTDAQAVTQSQAADGDRYAWAVWQWLKTHDKTGKTKSYLYYFTHAPQWLPGVTYPGSAQTKDPNKLGVYRYSELNYVFGTLGMYAKQRQYTDMDYKLSDLFASYWVNFAKTGDPNGPGLPVWPVFDGQAANPILYIGDQTQVGPLPNKAGLEFWEAFSYLASAQ